jgi:hypothetical protein
MSTIITCDTSLNSEKKIQVSLVSQKQMKV